MPRSRILDDDPMDPTGYIGSFRDLSFVCERDDLDHVVVRFSRSQPEDMIEALRPCAGRLAITVVPGSSTCSRRALTFTISVQILTGISVGPVSFGVGGPGWSASARSRPGEGP